MSLLEHALPRDQRAGCGPVADNRARTEPTACAPLSCAMGVSHAVTSEGARRLELAAARRLASPLPTPSAKCAASAHQPHPATARCRSTPTGRARGCASAPRICDGPLYPRAQAFRHARQHVHVNVPARRAASGLRATELHEPGMTKGSVRAQPADACARVPRRLTH